MLRQSTEEVRAFLKPFTLVVAANLPEQLLVQLAEACAVSFASTTTTTTTTLPLVSVRAYGFLGTVRCQYMKHEVVESKPDATKPDLRIAQVPCAMYLPCACHTPHTPILAQAHLPVVCSCAHYPTFPLTHAPIDDRSIVHCSNLSQPFPELVTFCDAFDLDSMDSQHHSHVPFVVILYKALSQW